jgi:two-component system NarL family response regulator
MLTSSEAEEDIFRALHAGALGYVLKTACPEELLETIRAVHEGRSVLSAAVRARLEEREGSMLLTARELEVLQYVRKGLSNAEIGRFLNVSMHTAKAHVASVLKKLDATDRAEAVGRAFERGILRP